MLETTTRFSNYHRQNWSLPDSMIYYISKNPSTTKIYQKLTKTCKYFFIKNPILVISDLCYSNNYDDENEWEIWINDEIQKQISWETIKTNKFWITGFININSRYEENLTTFVIPRIYQCDIKHLSIGFQEISRGDLLILAPTVEMLMFESIIVKDDNGSVIKFEKVVEFFSKLKTFQYFDDLNLPYITAKTFKELVKIENFQKLDEFYLFKIQEVFDIETFYIYMKTNKNTQIALNFLWSEISEIYKSRLQEIVNEIIDAKEHNFKVPHIVYDGIDNEINEKMLQLF